MHCLKPHLTFVTFDLIYLLIIAFFYVDNQEYVENPVYEIKQNPNDINSDYIENLFWYGWVAMCCTQRLSDKGFEECTEQRNFAKGESLKIIVSALRDHVLGNMLRDHYCHHKFLHMALASIEALDVYEEVQGFYLKNISRLDRKVFEKMDGTKEAFKVISCEWQRMDSDYGYKAYKPFCDSEYMRCLYRDGIIDKETLIILPARDEDDYDIFLGLRKVQMEEVIIDASDHPVYALMDSDYEDHFLNAKTKGDELKKHNKGLKFLVFRVTNATLRHWRKKTTTAVREAPQKKK